MVPDDEYSYPPDVDLTKLGVQLPAPSTRRTPTKRVYNAPLDDAAIARCRAKSARRVK